MKSTVFFDHKAVEKKWQTKWSTSKVYQPDLKKSNSKFYNLFMFPYPSAEGLHVGHAYSSSGSDVYGRFKRMQGYDVFEPMGLDGFGIHAENYALKIGKHPMDEAKVTEKRYYEQFRSLGNSYAWDNKLETYDPDYYRWTQWLFIKLFKAGLAYKKKAEVNWCPSCKTVLADEQVVNGECERCQSTVGKKELEQWFLKITDYADRLLSNLDKIDWPEKIKIAQTNWIGRSEGMYIEFDVEGSSEKIKVFTTRPDTLASATFIAVASGHENEERTKEKKGKFTGKYARNPLNGRKLPVWETNYVEASYGTGAVMGVPAYDDRDMEFAKKYKIEVVKEKIAENDFGTKAVTYHLRDWLISRQRYWGPPIPMIFCKKDGWQPVPEEGLPVLLPHIKDYQPIGTGVGPLASHKEFYEVKCPSCGEIARRETDVSDTFLDSAWYFLRYPSVGTKSDPWDAEITKNWLPVDLYFGGAEHAVLHLMYARFITMFLYDQKLLHFEEPFPKFYAHGLVIKDGAKMSKSKGNVISPDKYIEKYGADTLRLYLMFMGPMDGYPDFRDTGIEGMRRFVEKLWKIFNQKTITKPNSDITIKMHQTIKKVTEDVSEFKYNTAISAVMEFVNVIKEKKTVTKEQLEVLVKLIAPFAPHLAEEVWVEVLDNKFSVHTNGWPKYDLKYLEVDELKIIVQVNGKMRGSITVNKEISKEEIEKIAKEDTKVIKWIDGKIRKTIYVPGKIVNFVTD